MYLSSQIKKINAYSTEDRAERHDFYHDFGYSFSLFLFPTKKRGKKRKRMKSKNRDQKSCLSARSQLKCALNFRLIYNNKSANSSLIAPLEGVVPAKIFLIKIH